MAFTWNGNTPAAITLNGHAVSKLTYNGVTVWEADNAVLLGSLSAGTVVMVEESTGYVPWVVITHDHHGEGLTTLVRQCADTYQPYHYSVPSSAYYNRYSNSRLKSDMASYYSDNLTAGTRAKIQSVDIPIRESANNSTSQAYVTSNLFALSEPEVSGSGSSYDGTQIPYFDSNEKRICYTSSGTSVAYWLRSVLSGMSDYARVISTSGSVSNGGVTSTSYIRPACCINSGTKITERNGQYYME